MLLCGSYATNANRQRNGVIDGVVIPFIVAQEHDELYRQIRGNDNITHGRDFAVSCCEWVQKSRISVVMQCGDGSVKAEAFEG